MPEFVDGVVDIAQRGRSLGIHLIMATQRPAGVIKDNLRANTNLRMALRMADESDSSDVVDETGSRRPSPTVPGRAIAKTGPGRLVPFQSAYAGGWSSQETPPPPTSSGGTAIRIDQRRWELDDPTATPTRIGGPGAERPEADRRDAGGGVRSGETSRPRRPWLDDLETAVGIRATCRRGDPARFLLGKRDVPERQLQEAASTSSPTATARC